MKKDNKHVREEQKEKKQSEAGQWINKAEAFIDDTAEKIHQSDAYRKAGKATETATKKMFRQAGKWWGKSEKYFKK